LKHGDWSPLDVIWIWVGADDAVDSAFDKVREAADHLCLMSAEDFPARETVVTTEKGATTYVFYDPFYDSINNIISFKKRVTKKSRSSATSPCDGMAMQRIRVYCHVSKQEQLVVTMTPENQWMRFIPETGSASPSAIGTPPPESMWRSLAM
jgi:hypothetical protein